MSIIGDAVGGLISSIGDQAIKVRTAITGVDPATAGKLQEIAANLDTLKEQGQQAVNKAQTDLDAQYAGVTGTNFFKFWCAGPRPFILWICGVAFALQYVVVPLAHWFGWMVPVIDMGVPTQVVLGALGLGNIVTRSVEKINSAAGNH